MKTIILIIAFFWTSSQLVLSQEDPIKEDMLKEIQKIRKKDNKAELKYNTSIDAISKSIQREKLSEKKNSKDTIRHFLRAALNYDYNFDVINLSIKDVSDLNPEKLLKKHPKKYASLNIEDYNLTSVSYIKTKKGYDVQILLIQNLIEIKDVHRYQRIDGPRKDGTHEVMEQGIKINGISKISEVYYYRRKNLKTQELEDNYSNSIRLPLDDDFSFSFDFPYDGEDIVFYNGYGEVICFFSVPNIFPKKSQKRKGK